MGLLDKLLNKGAKALGDMVSDKISDVVNGDNELGETLRNVKSTVSSISDSSEHDTWEEAGSRIEQASQPERSSQMYEEDKSFDEKLRLILQNAGRYELREYISPDTLEKEFGQKIYTRGGGRYEPEDITYGIYQGGNRVLFIRFWDSYCEYARVANREIKSFCDANNVKMLDFFEYLPNEEDYMDQRIREQLV